MPASRSARSTGGGAPVPTAWPRYSPFHPTARSRPEKAEPSSPTTRGIAELCRSMRDQGSGDSRQRRRSELRTAGLQLPLGRTEQRSRPGADGTDRRDPGMPSTGRRTLRRLVGGVGRARSSLPGAGNDLHELVRVRRPAARTNSAARTATRSSHGCGRTASAFPAAGRPFTSSPSAGSALDSVPGIFPAAEAAADRTLALPVHYHPRQQRRCPGGRTAAPCPRKYFTARKYFTSTGRWRKLEAKPGTVDSGNRTLSLVLDRRARRGMDEEL